MPEKGAQMIETAFLCDRMGPYHYARLSAAGRLLKITGIEFSALDHTNLWEPYDDRECRRITLFADKPIIEQPFALVIKRVRSVLDGLKPQAVVVSGWDALVSLAALQWCVNIGTPAVMMSESQERDEQRTWWKEAVKRKIVGLNSAGFAGGGPQKAYLKALGIPEERIFTGCDAIDNDYFAKGADLARGQAAALRDKYSLPEKYFLSSGRFVPKKNIAALLKAYAVYRKNGAGNPWKLVLLGDGPLKPELVKLREELGLADSVLMPGFVQYPDLPAYYGLAGAFILPSVSEQWGLVVNEAMASGLPVLVSSRCGCASDLVADGQNGFVFEPEDIDGLARHLSVVSGDGCDRNKLGEAGRAIIGGWSPAVFAENLKNAVETAMKVPPTGYDAAGKALLFALINGHLRMKGLFR